MPINEILGPYRVLEKLGQGGRSTRGRLVFFERTTARR